MHTALYKSYFGHSTSVSRKSTYLDSDKLQLPCYRSLQPPSGPAQSEHQIRVQTVWAFQTSWIPGSQLHTWETIRRLRRCSTQPGMTSVSRNEETQATTWIDPSSLARTPLHLGISNFSFGEARARDSRAFSCVPFGHTKVNRVFQKSHVRI